MVGRNRMRRPWRRGSTPARLPLGAISARKASRAPGTNRKWHRLAEEYAGHARRDERGGPQPAPKANADLKLGFGAAGPIGKSDSPHQTRCHFTQWARAAPRGRPPAAVLLRGR